MGRLQIVLDDKLEKNFRNYLGKERGLKKGMISEEIERLISMELKEIPITKASSIISLNPNEKLFEVIKKISKIQDISVEEFIIKALNFICFERPELLGLELK